MPLTALFTLGALLHNLEEAVWLPRWSTGAGRLYPRVEPGAFRIAAGMISLLIAGLAVWAARAPAGSLADYLFAGMALALALNALVPHLLATCARRRYMPGTATGLALNLPLGLRVIQRSLAEHRIQASTFLWAGPLLLLAFLGLLPLLLALGRRIAPVSRP